MTAVVRSLFRTTTDAPQPANPSSADAPQRDFRLGGDCLCGRGQAIGTCIVSDTRVHFRAFHEDPAAYHLQNVTHWACVDCVADAALDVANGVIRERMREIGRQRDEQWAALQRQNEMRKAAGLPIVQTAIIPEGCGEWPTGGER